ncbi:MAG: A/G-specific adenine glycosylase [Bacteroidales bacterium]|nr:A/G-specific adenine glycosylase [Bacteroidales bacterium]
MKIDGIIRGWYEKNRRDLPWRNTGDPYRIWLSEVILQQTRVSQGLDYYLEFTRAFPDVVSLARASEDEVLKKWQGLGYYSRARNLHEAARHVVDRLQGQLPGTYQGLLELKGVGTYTASAIASICFGEPRAVVDGNVSRVISRLFGVEEPVNSTTGGKIIASLADELLDRQDPGTHNQAMMEFGALLCLPVSPDCDACPLKDHCVAWRTGRVEFFPVKIPKQKPVNRWIYYFILRCQGETIITKRGRDDIWPSLYQFPVVESAESIGAEEIIGRLNGALLPGAAGVTIHRISDPIKHQLTHRTIHARFIHVDLGLWPRPLPSGWIKISMDRLDDFPVARLINRYMEVAKF